MTEKKLLGIDIGEILNFGLDAFIYRSLGMRIRGLQQGAGHGNSTGEGDTQKRDRVTFGFLSTKDEERWGEIWQDLNISQQRALMSLRESLLSDLPPKHRSDFLAKAAREHIWDSLRKKVTNMEVVSVTTEENVADDPQTGKKRVGKRTTQSRSKGLLYLRWLGQLVIDHGVDEAKCQLRTGNMIPNEAPFVKIVRWCSPAGVKLLDKKYGKILRGNEETRREFETERMKTRSFLYWVLGGVGILLVMLVVIIHN